MVDVGEMPGTVLAREIAKRGWTQQELASIIKRPPGLISAIIRGRKCITTETARDFEAVFGIIASEWLAIDACYRLSKIRKNRQMKDEIISKRSEQRGVISTGVPIGFVSSEDLIDILWERGVPPTVVAEQMAFLSECRDADNLRAEMVRKMKAEAE